MTRLNKKGLVLFASAEGGTMPINRLLKNKRPPEEIELLNKAFNHALDVIPIIVLRAGKGFLPLNYTREEMNIRDLQEQMGEMERGL